MVPQNARVLVVDDSISIVESLSKVLHVSGYETDPAYNGREALKKLNENTYDIIICDIEMPGMTGLDLLRHVRNEFGDDIAFILITGFLEQDYFLKAIRLGASDFIRKPIDAQVILNAIKTQLEKRKDSWDYLEVSKLVNTVDIHLTLTPVMFRDVDFVRVFTKFFKNNLNFPVFLMNELLLCIEEMLYNAFIHGTLKLAATDRTTSYDAYQSLITSKLCDAAVADKKIDMRLHVNQLDKLISIEVEDEGEGFDHEIWMQKIKTHNSILMDEYGRGISIIYNLCDNVSFSKGGRQIRIEKSIVHGKKRSVDSQ